jgi:hypothetical protein
LDSDCKLWQAAGGPKTPSNTWRPKILIQLWEDVSSKHLILLSEILFRTEPIGLVQFGQFMTDP